MKTATATPPAQRCFLWSFICLLLVLGALFSRSFQSSQVLFSSDGPLGANMANYTAMPAAYMGMWQDLYWVGGRVGSAFPSLTYFLLWALKPLGFAKFYTPICLLVLGLSVTLFFRQLGFRPLVCLLGALAAALNTDFLSYACWGLGTLPLTIASVFVALSALVTPATERLWLRAALAGLGVGMAVMEGFDSGAIMSLYVAAFVLFQSLTGVGGRVRRWLEGVWRLALVVGMAVFIAAQAMTVLIGTQIQGVVGMKQDTLTKTQRWDQATQWSLPKIETLRVIIPGLFGYRMDTPEGGNYWGGVGQTPGVIQSRHSGSGVYGGVLVAVLAFWALLQSLREKASPFSLPERRAIWFWSGTLLVSLLLAWGRHAPFYQLLYALPYFSTIRNPVKFMHPFNLALVILFGYGLQSLCRSYLEKAIVPAGTLSAQLKSWWAKAAGFDRQWMLGLVGALGVSLLGWLLYFASRNDLEEFLKKAVPGGVPAAAIAQFSLLEVGWFILFLAVTALILLLIYSGVLAGARARLAQVCLLLLLIADFSRASVPWIFYWNYQEKYASNPILDLLRERPYEQRVVVLPFQANELLSQFQYFYHSEWIQHAFPYYNIQSLDIVQEPRAAADNVAYRENFRPGAAKLLRMWELTNTRYVLSLAGGFTDALNQQLDPAQKRFRLHRAFTIEPPGLLVRTNTQGPFALLEFTGALPRAKLYARWLTSTNDAEALKTLADPAFDPTQTVLVSTPVPAPTASALADTNRFAGTVEFASYAPKRIQLRAKTTSSAMLLVNDKFESHWRVTVDGQPQPLLRCNVLMRGVYLTPGEHVVEFSFGLPRTALAVSVAALGVGLILVGMVCMEQRRRKQE